MLVSLSISNVFCNWKQGIKTCKYVSLGNIGPEVMPRPSITCCCSRSTRTPTPPATGWRPTCSRTCSAISGLSRTSSRAASAGTNGFSAGLWTQSNFKKTIKIRKLPIVELHYIRTSKMLILDIHSRHSAFISNVFFGNRSMEGLIALAKPGNIYWVPLI